MCLINEIDSYLFMENSSDLFHKIVGYKSLMSTTMYKEPNWASGIGAEE